jgi:hypothetical protein
MTDTALTEATELYLSALSIAIQNDDVISQAEAAHDSNYNMKKFGKFWNFMLHQMHISELIFEIGKNSDVDDVRIKHMILDITKPFWRLNIRSKWREDEAFNELLRDGANQQKELCDPVKELANPNGWWERNINA